MLPSWIRSRNCRPRLVYFLAIEITRRRLASTISFLAWRASRSPFCTVWTMRRNSSISRPVSVASVADLARAYRRSGPCSLATNSVQPRPPSLRDAQHPFRVELRAVVVLQELGAADAIAVGQRSSRPSRPDQALVDVVELLDQRLDAVVVQLQRLHVGDDLVLQRLVLALLGRRERARSAALPTCSSCSRRSFL